MGLSGRVARAERKVAVRAVPTFAEGWWILFADILGSERTAELRALAGNDGEVASRRYLTEAECEAIVAALDASIAEDAAKRRRRGA